MKNIFRKYCVLILLCVISVLTVSANAYIIHSVNGNVKVSSGGKITSAIKGNYLKKSDLISVPEGGGIKILDESTKKIYTSVTSGNTSVENLISQSLEKAADNAGQLNSRLHFSARGEKVAVDSRVYREKGMVTRSLNLFDGGAANIEIAPDVLAQLIANTVYFDNVNGDSTLMFNPIHIDSILNTDTLAEFGFKLYNPLETPVYFNVLKFSGVNNRSAEISSLGQPGGFYILPAGQTMWRTRHDEVPYGEKHLIVACHYSFDIDSLIESLNRIINNDNLIINAPDSSLPVFIRKL
ncbi:MAG: hypothetical protein K2M94_06180 [Paramuribaculum sp.]|nr:hypothetical protein [Paramuribaculum sp.]